MKIFLEFPNKNVFAFQVSNNDKILKLKNEINKLFGSILQEYILTYDDLIMNNDKTWEEYKIDEKSLIIVDRGDIMIFVETMNEMSLGLKLDNLMIFELMKKVQEKIGIAEGDQILICDNELLEGGGKLLREFGISGNSVIRVLDRSRGEMAIFVETRFDEKRFVIGVNKSDKILHMKYKIEEKIGWRPCYQKLIFQDELLNNDYKTIDEYQICEKSVIEIIAIVRDIIQISIKRDGRYIMPLRVCKSDKIRDIKYKIQKKQKWSNELRWVYNGDKLDDDKTIGEYGISENDTYLNVYTDVKGGGDCDICCICCCIYEIILEIKENKKKSDSISGMQIFIEGENGNAITIEVKKHYKIKYIKHKIQDKLGLYSNEQKLCYKGKILNDNNKKIGQYQICNQSVINIVSRLRFDRMQFFVKIVDGKGFSIEIEKSDKISDVKHKIHEKSGLSPNEQKLVYQDEILNDDETIFNEYELYESTIDFISISNNKILIFAEIINREILIFTMPINSIISDVKNEINRKLELTINDEILIYHDNISHDNDDSKLINQYQSNMVLQLTIRSKYEKSFIIDLSKHENIREIKKSIKSKLKINEKHEKIIFHNKQLLTNDKVIYSYEIVPRSIIDLDYELREFRLFIQSIKKGPFNAVQKHFQKEFLEKKHGSYLRYPIHYAVRYNYLEIINYLINQQCNIESVDFENIRPIHYACYYGTGDILKLFIENKCDLESSDLMKRRPIHFACYHENREIIYLLIENRCELDIKDLMNQTPLKICRKYNFKNMYKILKEEIIKRKMYKIAAAMNLKCPEKCDHICCHIRYFRSLLTKKIDEDEIIGEGSYGTVYKCQETFTGKKFAVKIIYQKTCMRKYIENNINNFMESLNHSRIIKYFGAVKITKKLFIFMELLSRISLESRIKSGISLEEVIIYTKQMLEAITFLHKKTIVHRDIKPENILFVDENNLKIVDFGLSLMLTNTDGVTEKAVTFCGTKEFMAPEIINSDLYSCSVDIWSLGISVIYMVTGKIPLFKIWPTIKIEYQLPNSLPAYFKDLIDEMLIPDPEKRISAEHLSEKFQYL